MLINQFCIYLLNEGNCKSGALTYEKKLSLAHNQITTNY